MAQDDQQRPIGSIIVNAVTREALIQPHQGMNRPAGIVPMRIGGQTETGFPVWWNGLSMRRPSGGQLVCGNGIHQGQCLISGAAGGFFSI